ncbi:MAG: MBL fold metallo-hydrolase [Evtepia sp.]
MDLKEITIEQVKGNTWVLKSWVVIPFYKVDDSRCILLDSGIRGQEQPIEDALAGMGLSCVGIIGSHAHMDHTGSHAYFQKKHGAKIAMSLGEAGIQSSQLGLEMQSGNLSPKQVAKDDRLKGTECVADIIIMPQDRTVTIAGATFDVIHTPGHTSDHIVIRTPDHVLYLGDAIMTGRELYKAKFPYALSIAGYFESLSLLRTEPADFFIAAHWGVYTEIMSFIDMEIRFLAKRMEEILELVTEKMTVPGLTRKMCEAYHISAHKLADISYFERATRAYLYYLLDRDQLELMIEDNTLWFQRTPQSYQTEKKDGENLLPRPGMLSVALATAPKT